MEPPLPVAPAFYLHVVFTLQNPGVLALYPVGDECVSIS